MTTIGDLRERIKDLPAEMPLIIPLNAEDGFTGEFFSPCQAESGVVQIPDMSLTEEDFKKYSMMGTEPPKQDVFLLAPHGFVDAEHDKKHLN